MFLIAIWEQIAPNITVLPIPPVINLTPLESITGYHSDISTR